MLTSGQIATIRSWIGKKTPPSDLELDPIHTRTGSIKGVVEEVLRKRLADFESSPGQFAVAGDYSQATVANMESLRKRLADLANYDVNLVKVDAVTDDAPYVGVQRIVRRNRRRR